MKIGINGSFIRKANTGIGQVTLNALKALSNFQFSIPDASRGQVFNFQSNPNSQISKPDFFIYLEEDLPKDLDLPDNFTKRIFLPLWKRDDLIRKIWWEKYLLPRKVKEDKCDVFLSLYQCPSIFKLSPFGKGRVGEGFEKYWKKENVKSNDSFQIPRGCYTRSHPPPFLKGEKKERGRDGIKHIMIVHDIIPKLFPEYLNNSRKKLYWKLTEKAIKKADKIMAVSEHTKKDLIQYLNIAPEKISVNYINVDGIYKKEVSEEKSREVLKKYNLKPGYIYSGGGLEKRKNVGRLLKAYKLLLKNFEFRIPDVSRGQVLNFDSNINDRISNEKKEIQNSKLNIKDSIKIQNSKFKIPKLVISGKLMPELAPLITDAERLVKDLGLQDKVKLLNFVPQEDLPALYKNASVFVYPSLYEGFGLPVLEAMNCGTPVVCSSNSSIPEIVSFQIPPNPPFPKGEMNKLSPFGKGGRQAKRAGGFENKNNFAAILFNPENTKDIAEKIEKVLSDKNLQNELSMKGKEQAKKFSWDKFAEKVLALAGTL